MPIFIKYILVPNKFHLNECKIHNKLNRYRYLHNKKNFFRKVIQLYLRN